MLSKKPKPSAGDAGSGKNVGNLAATNRVLPQIATSLQADLFGDGAPSPTDPLIDLMSKPLLAMDRASAVTTAVLQIIAQHPSPPRNGGALRNAISAYLRDEFADVVRQAVSEIRPMDE